MIYVLKCFYDEKAIERPKSNKSLLFNLELKCITNSKLYIII